VLVFFAVLAWVPLLPANFNAASENAVTSVNTATEIRVLDPGWWPTKSSPAREDYVGSAVCAKCHGDKAGTQKSTAMAHALTIASSAEFDSMKAPLIFKIGSYSYEIGHSADGAVYSVKKEGSSTSVPLGWIFGQGQFGKTYLYSQNGSYFESRISFYSAIRGLDFTAGSPRVAPNRLETALGRRMSSDEPPRCFGCHSTAANTNNKFDPSQLIPGVTCEACHGPGAQHVAAMSLGDSERSATFIMNPGRLNPIDAVDFCGACHRTSVDVSLAGVTGILTLRFPAYRLQRSRCWGTGDSRLVCAACHDAHRPLAHDVASYDRQCLNCHLRDSKLKAISDHPGRACPISETACVSCHMPKFNIPEMHTSFTDHKIRIYKPGEAFTE
jgi:Cytochrome c554 and c-prime